jgi:hypothetical protein
MTQLFVPIVGGEFMCCATIVARSFFYNSLFPHCRLPFFRAMCLFFPTFKQKGTLL